MPERHGSFTAVSAFNVMLGAEVTKEQESILITTESLRRILSRCRELRGTELFDKEIFDEAYITLNALWLLDRKYEPPNV